MLTTNSLVKPFMGSGPIMIYFSSYRELTLFWSKLLMRSESSADSFLDQCRKLVLLSRNVCHILFLIKVIQSEVKFFVWNCICYCLDIACSDLYSHDWLWLYSFLRLEEWDCLCALKCAFELYKWHPVTTQTAGPPSAKQFPAFCPLISRWNRHAN